MALSGSGPASTRVSPEYYQLRPAQPLRAGVPVRGFSGGAVIDDRERGASGARSAGSASADPGAWGRSGAADVPPSVPARVTVGPPSLPVPEATSAPGPGSTAGVAPAPRGVVAPIVPLARPRAVRRGMRPGGAAAATEPLRDLVETAVRSGPAAPSGPRRADPALLAPLPPSAPRPPTPSPTPDPAPEITPCPRPAPRSVVVPAAATDSTGWAATSAVASGVIRRLERWRRAWTWRHSRRLLAVTTSVLVVLVCGLAWGATSWFENAVRQIAALDPSSTAIVDPAAQTGDQNFLVVGSDTRVGATPTEDAGDPDDVPGARSDTVMIVHVPLDRSRVSVVSFPRDLEIDRPSCERWDPVSGEYTAQSIPAAPGVKLNSAYQVGGPRCVTKVVQQLSGLAVNHFLGVDFSGFKDMVDAVDGVPVCVEKPMRDTVLGTVVPRAGTAVLSGDQALNFVRARHVLGDPTSDYGRIHRQQLFLAALLRQSLTAGTLLDLGRLQGLVGAVSRSTYGENIEADQMLGLGQSLSGLNARDVTFTTVPTTGVANHRGNEVLRTADDRALFDAIIRDQPLPGQPGAAPLPGQPGAAPLPGRPGVAPLPGQPGVAPPFGAPVTQPQPGPPAPASGTRAAPPSAAPAPALVNAADSACG